MAIVKAAVVRTAQPTANQRLLTSMDSDGQLTGYDLSLTAAVARAVTVPVIASGGVGTCEHMYEGATVGQADALLAASIFHYGTLRVRDVKNYLSERGVPVRPIAADSDASTASLEAST